MKVRHQTTEAIAIIMKHDEAAELYTELEHVLVALPDPGMDTIIKLQRKLRRLTL